jgi:hypothetical protein
MARPKPRKWTPRNPEKYIGDADNIIARSSWEVKMFNWCDTNPQVIKYCSEELIIPYMSPVDKKMHKYFPDLVMEVQDNNKITTRYVVEIKPFKETIPPKTSKKSQQLFEATKTFVVNSAKWAAADQWCVKNNFKFIILTEKELNIYG